MPNVVTSRKTRQTNPNHQTLARLGLLLLTTLAAGCSPQNHRARTYPAPWLEFVGFTNFSKFAHRGTEWTSPEIPTRVAWDELVVSWNVDLLPGAGLKVEARAIFPERATAYYTLGWWAQQGTTRKRESVNGQRDEDGDVKTDTLVLERRSHRAQVRLTLFPGDNGILPRMKFLGLSFAGEPGLVRRTATAQPLLLDVPVKSQLAYEGGRDWCSPTSLAMVLSYWAAKLGRPELSNDVPAVASAVYDRNWPGTGNWPFNTAYAGSFPGMRAFVTRFADVSEIEAWIAAGVPVIASVSSTLLNGGTTAGGGHLVVCVGFGADDTIILNDPWRRELDGRRKEVPIRDFVRAWRDSRQTVYLVHPEQRIVPRVGVLPQ